MKKLSLISLVFSVLLVVFLFHTVTPFSQSSQKISATDELSAGIAQSNAKLIDVTSDDSEQVRSNTQVQDTITNGTGTNTAAEFNDDISVLECIKNIVIDMEGYEQGLKDYFSSLADAEGKEQQLLYTLFSPAEEDKKSKQLVEYIESGNPSGSEIVALNAVASCTNAAETLCDENFLNQVVQYDSQNGVMWFYQALAYLRLGNEQAAIAAIAEIPKSPFFNARMGEEALLYAEALNQSEHDKFSINAFAGFQRTLMRMPSFSGLTEWCLNEANEMSIANACLTLGRELSQRSTLMIDKMIGFALQESAYAWLKDDAALADIKAKQNKASDYSINERFTPASIMILLDDRLARRWLTLMDEYGELATSELLIKEADELYQNDNNLICSTIYDLLN